MPESPKVDLVFEYTRSSDGMYSGSATVLDRGESTSVRPPLHVVVHQPDWVRFVVDTIRHHKKGLEQVAFELKKPDQSSYRYVLDQRTVEKIQDETFPVEDLIL